MKKITLVSANQTVVAKYFLLAILFHLLIGNNVKSQGIVLTGTVTTVYETRVNLTAGNRVRFETRNLSPGSDPVINLLSTEGMGVMAVNNGGPDFAEQLNYLPIRTGSYFLIVRSRSMERRGTADIYKDGVLLNSQVSFGGWRVSLQNLRSGEILQTVKLPGCSNGNHKIYILKEDQVGIQTRATSLDSGLALIKLTTAIGNKTVVIGTDFDEGLVRLIRNDAGIPFHDLDNDGLGTELERSAGTCSSRSGRVPGCDCSQIADARDTDGDGISDGWELLGRYDILPFQLLPKWGANPRHKDLFIEVDFMCRNGNENVGPKVKMPAAVAKRFADIYGDAYTTSSLLKLFHASVLKNPDGITGVSVHLDTGRDSEPGDEVTIYGNWGGYTAVKSTKSDGTECTPGTPADLCKGSDPNIVWKTNMESARRGIFRYTLGYTGGGGSTPQNAFACAFNFLDLTNSAHEFGHTLGMGHSGPYDITGVVDVNCKPNYPSIMNYAFLSQPGVGFSDGNGIPALNNSSLKEWNAVSPSNTLYMDVLERVFRYWVDRNNGHVDWNRNGVFEPANQTVKAYANYRPGGDCEFTRYNQFHVSDAQTATTPVLARLKDRLYIFYANHGSLKYRYTTSSLNCPQPKAEACDNAVWGPEKDAGLASVGVDVMNDGNSLRVVSIELFGKIMERRLSLVLGQENWTQPVQIPGSAKGDPSLSFGLIGSYLLYKGSDDFIHFNKMVAGQWQTSQVAHTINNEPIKTTNTGAYPAIIQTVLPGGPGFLKSLYGLFPDENGFLDMWRYNSTDNFWEKTDVLENPRPGPISGKPSMAYMPYKAGMENPGRLYMLYLRKPAEGSNAVIRMRMSYVKVLEGADGTFVREEKIGLDSYFDNSWLTTYGISLFFEQGKDSNVRSVFSIGGQTSNYNIMFRPKADAINDFRYINYNDWETIRKNLCQRVVNPGGTVTNPIRCSVN